MSLAHGIGRVGACKEAEEAIDRRAAAHRKTRPLSKRRGEAVTVEAKSMDIKKTQDTTQTKEKKESAASALHFVSDVKAEFKKITWTPREELWAYTKIIVTATIALGFGIYFVDLAIKTFLDGLSQVLQFFGG